VSSDQPNGYRLDSIERRLDRLDALELAVVKQQVQDIKGDIGEIKDDMASIRKILIGFLVTFAFSAITTVVAVLSLTGGTP
jgi:hypothetical protein